MSIKRYVVTRTGELVETTQPINVLSVSNDTIKRAGIIPKCCVKYFVVDSGISYDVDAVTTTTTEFTLRVPTNVGVPDVPVTDCESVKQMVRSKLLTICDTNSGAFIYSSLVLSDETDDQFIVIRCVITTGITSS